MNLTHLTKSLTLALTLSYSINTLALPSESRVPGGIAIIELDKVTSTQAPEATLNGQRVMVTQESGKWLAIVGIPLKAKIDEALTVKAAGKSYSFNISDNDYPEQRLTGIPSKYVEPDPKQVARWREESKVQNTAYKTWSEPNAPVLELAMPAQGPYSSAFGLKRFFNDQPRAPHSGLDIAAPDKSPIKVAAAGKVTAVGEYFFNGNTVIVDHGHGLSTMYCHMSRIDVKVGDQLELGEQIGLVGKTGRVTGPHLHWGVSLNNTRVDPLLFVKAQ
ncbi:M23 family metallopeptidase [Marinobacterium sp. LSUCC0821]|uniref:M23 family metallopeptidase n=1 Tax=Marinobacterium sp. LSUCC0821 TaxID=2668067 RepID=UPI001451E42A|nr:M23 family metallopeptidase [Marinobacterium sp. LSUCC0821]QJD71343.1 M23 family metallopeptidase [Marinobacterium sp. LSUCC0821]